MISASFFFEKIFDLFLFKTEVSTSTMFVYRNTKKKKKKDGEGFIFLIADVAPEMNAGNAQRDAQGCLQRTIGMKKRNPLAL